MLGVEGECKLCQRFAFTTKHAPPPILKWSVTENMTLLAGLCRPSSSMRVQIPGEASISLPRLRKKLESPGDGGRRVPAAALAAVDALEAIAMHLHAWDLKANQVAILLP